MHLQSILSNLQGLCGVFAPLHAIINLFDEHEPTEAMQALSASQVWLRERYELTWVAGMKTLFWKRILTPERTRASDHRAPRAIAAPTRLTWRPADPRRGTSVDSQGCPGWAAWVAGVVHWQRRTQAPASEPSRARASSRGIKYLNRSF